MRTLMKIKAIKESEPILECLELSHLLKHRHVFFQCCPGWERVINRDEPWTIKDNRLSAHVISNSPTKLQSTAMKEQQQAKHIKDSTTTTATVTDTLKWSWLKTLQYLTLHWSLPYAQSPPQEVRPCWIARAGIVIGPKLTWWPGLKRALGHVMSH